MHLFGLLTHSYVRYGGKNESQREWFKCNIYTPLQVQYVIDSNEHFIMFIQYFFTMYNTVMHLHFLRKENLQDFLVENVKKMNIWDLDPYICKDILSF